MRSILFEFSIVLFVAFICAAVANAETAPCRVGATLSIKGQVFRQCQIVGHSLAGAPVQKTFYASCAGEAGVQQIEYVENSETAQAVDMTSRAFIAWCDIVKPEMATLIKEYAAKNLEIENPKCYLTRWKGQMMYVADGVKGRCSFKMNRAKLAEFKGKTGVTPDYQCENDYFLSMGEKTGTSVYKKSKSGWNLACKASLRAGEPVEAIDWKNPPQYYEPEASFHRLRTSRQNI